MELAASEDQVPRLQAFKEAHPDIEILAPTRFEPSWAASDEWLKAHESWRIRQTEAWPGWWEATRNGSRMARYYDLADLMDRLEASF